MTMILLSEIWFSRQTYKCHEYLNYLVSNLKHKKPSVLFWQLNTGEVGFRNHTMRLNISSHCPHSSHYAVSAGMHLVLKWGRSTWAPFSLFIVSWYVEGKWLWALTKIDFLFMHISYIKNVYWITHTLLHSVIGKLHGCTDNMHFNLGYI